MTHPRLSTQCFAVAMLLATASLAHAQRPTPIPKDDFSSAGKIKAVQNGVFHVVNIGGDQWLVKVAADAKEVVLKGKATADWLRPGMPVKFEGMFLKNKSGQPQGESLKPIAKLKVFSLREDSKAGLKELARKGSFLSGGSKQDSAMDKTPFSVTGLLVKYKGGKMTVAVGNTQIRAQLASDAEIDVDIDDLRFAREGDEMVFEGWHYVGQKKQIHATNVWVTVSRPLGDDKAKKQVATKNGTDDEVAEEHRKKVRSIQLAISRASKSYEGGNSRQAATAVEAILADWNTFLKSDETTATRLLQPHHQQLKRIHAALEMDGFMLPVLRELPNSEDVAGS